LSFSKAGNEMPSPARKVMQVLSPALESASIIHATSYVDMNIGRLLDAYEASPIVSIHIVFGRTSCTWAKNKLRANLHVESDPYALICVAPGVTKPVHDL